MTKNIYTFDDSLSKESYKYFCRFRFNVWDYPQIPGYDLLEMYSFSTPQNKIPGSSYLHRDHRISVEYGWQNKIPFQYISHPANCEIMLEHDNVKKSSNISIELETLMNDIKNWDYEIAIKIQRRRRQSRKSNFECQSQRIDKIKKTMSGIVITDGKTQKWHDPSLPIPENFVEGKLPGNYGRKQYLSSINKIREETGKNPIPLEWFETILNCQIFCEYFSLDLTSDFHVDDIIEIQNYFISSHKSSYKLLLPLAGLSANNAKLSRYMKNFLNLKIEQIF